MKSIKKILISGVSIAGLALAGLGITTSPAQAVTCGYYSHGGYSYYNHCGSQKAYIQVDQVVGSYGQCVLPGTTLLRKNDGGLWQITNAFYLRGC